MDAGATPNRKLLAYRLSDGTRLSDQDTLLSLDNHDPQAIWSDGAHVWASDGDDHVVYAYALDDGSGATISAKHFHPWASIDPPQGLWSDGRVMYMARPGASKVYAYSVTTRAAHFRRDIELDPENTDGGGIWSDGETMWVLDTADAYVYAYDLRYQDSDYEAVTVYRKPSAEFRPSPQNDALGAGFTGHGLRVWIIDATDDPLYAYGLRNTPPTFPQSTVALDISETSGGDNCLSTVPFATNADDDTPSYSLGGPGADRFAFDSETRQINTAAGTANLQKGDRYSLTVHVTDGKSLLYGSDGSLDDSVGINVHVWENANPRFRGPSRIGLSFAESIRPGAPVAEIGVSDPDGDELQFSLANVAHGYTSQPFAYEDGRLRLQADKTLNFEHRNHYQLRLSVKDNKDLDGQPHAVWDDSVLIDIYLINVAETGRMTLNSANPAVGAKLVATLTDPTGIIIDPDHSVNWVLQKSETGVPGSWSQISSVDQDSASFEYTPVDADAGHFLRVTAHYWDRQNDSARRNLHSVTPNPVSSAEPTNVSPAFDEGASTTRTVAENAAHNDTIGTAIAATDSDEGDTLTYGLTGIDAGRFSIDDSCGQISLGAHTELNYEAKDSYSISVQVRDSKDAHGDPDTERDAQIAVTVQVTNVDETGVIASSTDGPLLNVALTAALSDPDGSVSGLVWQWQRANADAPDNWTAVGGATSDRYTHRMPMSAGSFGPGLPTPTAPAPPAQLRPPTRLRSSSRAKPPAVR